MSTAVVTVAAGGMPVVDVTATFPKYGLPVTEDLSGRGIAVTKVAASGMPVTFVAVGGGGASAEASAWLARAPSLNAAHIAADTAMINGLVADGDWASFDLIHVYATQSSAVALLNMVSPSFNGVIHGVPSFTVDSGFIIGAGSTSDYIDTTFNPATASSPKYTQNSAHMSNWCLTDTISIYNNMGAANAAGGSTPSMCLFERYTGSSAYFRVNVVAGGGPAAVTDSLGHFLGNRDTSTTIQGYKNGVSIYSGTAQASIAPLNLSMATLSLNVLGTYIGPGRRLALATIGSSLSPAAVTRVYNRFRTRLTAVGVP